MTDWADRIMDGILVLAGVLMLLLMAMLTVLVGSVLVALVPELLRHGGVLG